MSVTAQVALDHKAPVDQDGKVALYLAPVFVDESMAAEVEQRATVTVTLDLGGDLAAKDNSPARKVAPKPKED